MSNSGHLMSFLQRGKADERLSPTHVSFFLALFCCWEESLCQNPFKISRKIVMGLAKIQSTATYHKCVKEMSEFGFIEYKPSFHPFHGSEVKLLFD